MHANSLLRHGLNATRASTLTAHLQTCTLRTPRPRKGPSNILPLPGNRRTLHNARIPPPRRPAIRHAAPFSSTSHHPNRLQYYIRDARQNYPILLPTLLVATFGAVALLGFMLYDEMTRKTAYPPQVEESLRQALYYTHTENPEKATWYFEKTIEEAGKSELDPFGTQVVGIRIRYAEMLEHFGRVKPSIEVLQSLLTDCEAEFATSGKKGLVVMSLKIRAKMAELYDGEYVQDSVRAEKVLSEGLDLMGRNTNGFTESILPDEELAMVFSQMGDLMLAVQKHEQALQTFTASLNLLHKVNEHKPSCRQAQILQRMAIVLYTTGAKEALDVLNRCLDTVEHSTQDDVCDTTLLLATHLKARLLEKSGGEVEALRVWDRLSKSVQSMGMGEDAARLKAKGNLKSIEKRSPQERLRWAKGLTDEDLKKVEGAAGKISR